MIRMIDLFWSHFTAAMARELNTEVLYIMDMGGAVFLGLFLYKDLVKRGFFPMKENPGNKLAIGLFIHLVGLAILRGWSVTMYVLGALGLDPNVVEEQFQISLIGLMIAVLGMACIIRVISPPKWRHWGWITVYAAAVLFVAFIHIARGW